MSDFDTFPQMEEQSRYGMVVPLEITEADGADSVRKFLKAMTEKVGTLLMQTWLKDPGAYAIDITVEMRKR